MGRPLTSLLLQMWGDGREDNDWRPMLHPWGRGWGSGQRLWVHVSSRPPLQQPKVQRHPTQRCRTDRLPRAQTTARNRQRRLRVSLSHSALQSHPQCTAASYIACTAVSPTMHCTFIHTVHCSITHDALQSLPQRTTVSPTIHCSLPHNTLQSHTYNAVQSHTQCTAILPTMHCNPSVTSSTKFLHNALQSHSEYTAVSTTIHCSLTHNPVRCSPQCTAVSRIMWRNIRKNVMLWLQNNLDLLLRQSRPLILTIQNNND